MEGAERVSGWCLVGAVVTRCVLGIGVGLGREAFRLGVGWRVELGWVQ